MKRFLAGVAAVGFVGGAVPHHQPHWRNKRIVQSWPDLVTQVTRWQQIAGQNWTLREIDDVAAHLNRRFYKQPCPVAGCDGG